MNRILLVLLLVCLSPFSVSAESLEKTVEKVKPSVVGIGIFDPTGSPRSQLRGTGFVVGDGTLVATNFHVVEHALDEDSLQKRVVFVGTGSNPQVLDAEILTTDPAHDLAILKIPKKFAPLQLADNALLPDGRSVAFTGFPIGAVLGLYPATHRGIIAATTPVVIPSANAQQLSIEMMKRLRDPFMVYQLDATAYPGNSGSPVYDVHSGEVVAVINKVFVKESKESVLSSPSGISYAIPIIYLRKLLSDLDQ
ncbi:serine protease [Aliiglaciecola sp. CAU 1673]|uniref:S1 family peptidase n=1 Tax=Aliiglaciecola sp. CAU 1673 TaxID=3032595 RepID=UPI0023DA0753|nr:serine protease [Aliiglaciecola sp. CAU 1673]MDF2177325.1 serine protease [Aliiglaciecola sp. CAU 1673]